MNRTSWLAALAGIVTVAVVAVAGELLAAFVSPAVSPISAVGSSTIDLMPQPLKEWAIDTFGTADKAALLVTMVLVIAVLAAIAGIAEYRRRYSGVAIVVLFSLVGLAAVYSRPQAGPSSVIAPIAGAVLGIIILPALINRLRALKAAEDPAESAMARRRFLVATGAGAAVAVIGGYISTTLRSVQVNVAKLRASVTLPPPSSPAQPIPDKASIPLEGMPELVTPTDEFYRIDTAFTVPRVDPETWTLKVTGLVDKEVEINFAELMSKPLIERYVTLACVSNPVGGDLIGNASWLGWPIRELLAEAGPAGDADMVLSTSTDGWTAGTPLEVLTDERDAVLAVGMNGAPLPFEHGFPVRMVVPGLYGYVSATKWVTELKVTRFADEVAYWTTRGWAARGPIKLSSRIDTPRDGANRPPGRLRLGGVAWAQHVGVRAVEVRVDDGPWQPAELAEAISEDTWRQWVADVVLEPGEHELTVRATDRNGDVQIADFAPPVPSGATGHHSISVSIG